MKKVININFQGRVVPIEETSFEMLKQYTDSLRLHFANEEGRDEIINDIESRIGELFQERLTNGATCITDDDVNVIINNMGRPEDFGDEDQPAAGTGPTFSSGQYGPGFQPLTGTASKRLYRDDNNRIIGGVCSGIAAYFNIEPVIVRIIFIVLFGAAFIPYLILWALLPKSSSVINGVRKRLYRNPDDKLIAGVCSGLASYFGINVWIPRAIFLIPFISVLFRWGFFDFPNFIGFTFSPGSVIVYVILWLVIPEAATTSEKLEMKGERVDLNSIKNSVIEEMKEVQQRVSKLGKEATAVASEKSAMISSEGQHIVRKSRGGLGNVIVFLAKAFAYFVVAIVAIAVVAVLFGLAIAAIGLFPVITTYILEDGWQTVLAWGTLLFFIGVPVVGIITWLIRRLARAKRGSAMMRYSFIALWILGWFCAISLVASVARDFKRTSTPVEEKAALLNPGTSRLELIPIGNSRYYGSHLHFEIEPFANFDEDTVFVNNVRYRIVKSKTDSFEVTVVKMSHGRTRDLANITANKIQYKVEQVDSILYVDHGIGITKKDKFRNQRVEITIAVPVGKSIKLNKALGRGNWVHVDGPWNDWEWNNDWENEARGWDFGEEYTMKEDGLYTLDGRAADQPNRHHRDEWTPDDLTSPPPVPQPGGRDGGYRYDQTEKKIDSLKVIREMEMKHVKDSLEKAKEEINKTLKQLEEKNRREEANGRNRISIYSNLLNS